MNNKIDPPKFFLRFFRWYCHPKLVDHIEGDLLEEYGKRIQQYGKGSADRKFIVDVLLLFRRGIVRPMKDRQYFNSDMYKSYVKIGWRNLLRNSGYSVINITGLALGMVVAMLIGLWVYDEISFNKIHKNYERIALVVSHVSVDGETATYFSLPMPTSSELRTKFNNDLKSVAATTSMEQIVTYNDKVLIKWGCFAERALPDMLTLEMTCGNYTSFTGPSSVLLSQSFATAMFGDDEPLNKQLKIGQSLLQVVGVYKDVPQNSSFYGTNYIAPIELLFPGNLALDNWQSSSFQIYVLLNPNSHAENVSAKIANVVYEHTRESTKPTLALHLMERWHLYEFRNGKTVSGRGELVIMVGTVGAFILLLACINFVNLSTARSEKRVKEVGIRKALGSLRSQLIQQFLSESVMVVVFASLIAVAATQLLLPSFNNLSNKQIEIPWGSPWVWFALISFVFIVGLVAGSYPSFYLSSFQPIKVIRGATRTGRSASTPRRTLVVTQLTVSVMLIIGSTVVYNQIQFVKDRPIGYEKAGLISIPIRTTEFKNQFNGLRNELLKTNSVFQVSRSSSPTTGIYSSADNFDWEDKNPDRQVLLGTICIDPYFDDVVSWKLKEGRNFSDERATDTTGLIFNEAAIAAMGMQDPVGKRVRWHGKDWNIIGVVHDMIMTSPYGEATPTVFMIDFRERPFNVVNIKLKPGQAPATSLAEIEETFKRLLPNTPFNYQFADQEYARKFASEEVVGKLAFLFTLLAVIISSLGLIGLASFVAEQRTKEIGIRKVLGASVGQIWKMISSEFVLLSGIASVTAMPISYFIMSNWLMQFDYRVELDWYVFLVGTFGAILITLVAISFHATKAALSNPTESLRSE